ncbi:hypothetical protein [Thiothrix eikelboomii]|uniref:hypothetical protein n=1 Tax=Thiothrix eikelboomii TaxID=92487 RepID=UPI003BAE4747
MKHYLVIALFMLSFLANSSGLANLLFVAQQTAGSQQGSVAQSEPLPITVASEHCHQAKANQLPSAESGCGMGGACDNCFTHCGGALLTAEFPSFITSPPVLVSRQTHFYTPLLNTSLLRPPQIA